MGLALRWWQTLDVVGREHFPRQGPVVLLANHVAYFDPFTLMAAVRRPVHFMAAEGLFHDPLVGRLARWAGAVPRKKFVADLRSVRQLARWAKVGGAVGIFPEAERTWTGRTLPVVPPVGRLVRSFGHPVVTARFIGGYRQSPRWGRQRRGRVRVELDPPRTWGRRDDPDEIEAWLTERLQVAPDSGAGWPMKGAALAEGVENVLYRCPACDQLDSLRTSGDDLRCAACQAAWTMDIEHVLHPRVGGQPLVLLELLERLRGRAQEGEGPELLRSSPMTLLDITGEVSHEAARGALVLTPDRLFVDGSDWSLSLDDLTTIHVFMQRRLMIRSATHLWEAVLSSGSVLKWQWVTEARLDRT